MNNKTCSGCGKILKDGMEIVSVDGELYHKECHPDADFKIELEHICVCCGKIVTSNDQAVVVNGDYFHKECTPEGDPKYSKLVNDYNKKVIEKYHDSICENKFSGLFGMSGTEVTSVRKPGPVTKLDQGKNRLGLVLGGFSRALQEVGVIGTIGAKKYTDNGWMDIADARERYTDAMLRHYFIEETGELFDPDLTERAGKEIHHAGCVAWNALCRLELLLREEEEK